MTVLIFGRNGQLAKALQRSLIAQKVNFQCYGREQLDLLNYKDHLSRVINKVKPSIVINASAYTNVVGAEKNKNSAFLLNAEAPKFMARICKIKDIPFIHFSTDYVFDGLKKTAYMPYDKCNPLNKYGISKREGEKAIMTVGGRCLILRTSWVYDGTSKNFLTNILKQSKTKEKLNIVSTQAGRPTYAGHLAEACLSTFKKFPNSPKIYHITNGGKKTNWADFAQKILIKTGARNHINQVNDQFFDTIKRPKNSMLNIKDFEKDFQHIMEPWQAGVDLAFLEMNK
ncbi:dTDP-4-dehydrorhamnose reductase [Hellea sp.]|nr:dTDP-4-dehydrorhamnose reductase [Hellea sp.]